jgi:ankyrin repeat protein
MGTWGYNAFQNDNAADWLDELGDSDDPLIVENTLACVDKAGADAEKCDCEEAIAAATIAAGARYDPPVDLPVKARSWVKATGFVPSNKLLRLGLRVAKKIGRRSELRLAWQDSGILAGWQRSLERLCSILQEALTEQTPKRQPRPKARRATVADIMMEIAPNEQSARRRELLKKLRLLKDPNKTIGGKGLNSLTPLHWASIRGLIPEIELLIAKGANVNHRDGLMASPVIFAVKKNQTLALSKLLAAGGDVNAAFRAAAKYNRVAIMRSLVQRGHDPKSDPAVAHDAASTGATRSIRLLVSYGVPLDSLNQLGNTPLHEAVCMKQYSAARVLLDCGAKRSTRDVDGNTPAELAASFGLRKFARLLA